MKVVDAGRWVWACPKTQSFLGFLELLAGRMKVRETCFLASRWFSSCRRRQPQGDESYRVHIAVLRYGRI